MAAEFSNLLDARNSLNLTTDQLASRLGVVQSSVVRAEQSERKKTASIETLERAATALGMKFEYKFIYDADDHKFDELERARRLSPKERLLKAIELSELMVELKNAPKHSR